MTPAHFITKWRNAELKERSASQEHFLDLCELLDIEKPASAKTPERFEGNAAKLFAAMHKGGDLDFTPIEWFNGGLFDDDSALPLDRPFPLNQQRAG